MKKGYLKEIILKHKANYIGIAILFLMINLLALITPIIIGYTTDEVLSDRGYELNSIGEFFVDLVGGDEFIKQNIWVMGIAIIFVGILVSVLNFIKGKQVAKISEKTAEDIRNVLFKHLLELPYSYFNNINTGDIIQRCTSDIDNVRMFLSVHLMEVFRVTTLVAIALFYMVNINVTISILSTMLLPFMIIFSIYFINKVEPVFDNYEQKESAVNTAVQENVAGVRVVKAFNNQVYEIGKFAEINQNFNLALRKILKSYAVFWSVSHGICILQYLIAILSASYFGYKGYISAGEYVVFVSYTYMLIWPVQHLGRVFSEYGKAKIAYTRIEEILATPIEDDLEGGGTPSLVGDIVFDNLSFKFEDEEEYVLKNINLTINKGETVGIIGSIGSGKSTLMHMLLRLHNYDEGYIKINGNQLDTINKHYLRSNIGMALQDNFLYGKTILENLKMANPDVREDDIYNYAEIASIHSTIVSFKEGYDTQIGEKGVSLSGGQKQRTTIARTLLRNNDILIFDDSLSAVDAETDAKIRKRLNEVNNDTTTIIIAQRINTIMNCDKIVVMDKGRITHIGKHDELINTDGIYKKVWDIQNMQQE